MYYEFIEHVSGDSLLELCGFKTLWVKHIIIKHNVVVFDPETATGKIRHVRHVDSEAQISLRIRIVWSESYTVRW